MAWITGARIQGEWLEARNSASTGIHSDEFAQRQGFKRAVVAGPNHLSFVATLFEAEYGQQWLERGRIAARFVAPVYDGDALRAEVDLRGIGPDLDAAWRTTNSEWAVVAQGTAGWTTPGDSETRPARRPSSPTADLLDLRGLAVGERVPVDSVVASPGVVEDYCQLNHDALHRPGRVPTAYLTFLLFGPARRFLDSRGVGPGMWGETEIRQYGALEPGTEHGYRGTLESLRRRGNLEIVEFAFEALDEGGRVLCGISHTHIIPHREERDARPA